METSERSERSEKLASEMPMREKYWEESLPEDKIERLRDEVARLCAVVSQQAKIIAVMGYHRHAPDGSLMVSLADSLDSRPPSLFAHDNGIPHKLRKARERR